MQMNTQHCRLVEVVLFSYSINPVSRPDPYQPTTDAKRRQSPAQLSLIHSQVVVFIPSDVLMLITNNMLTVNELTFGQVSNCKAYGSKVTARAFQCTRPYIDSPSHLIDV